MSSVLNKKMRINCQANCRQMTDNLPINKKNNLPQRGGSITHFIEYTLIIRLVDALLVARAESLVRALF